MLDEHAGVEVGDQAQVDSLFAYSARWAAGQLNRAHDVGVLFQELPLFWFGVQLDALAKQSFGNVAELASEDLLLQHGGDFDGVHDLGHPGSGHALLVGQIGLVAVQVLLQAIGEDPGQSDERGSAFELVRVPGCPGVLVLGSLELECALADAQVQDVVQGRRSWSAPQLRRSCPPLPSRL